MAKQFHPDVLDSNCPQKFHEIQKAYDYLVENPDEGKDASNTQQSHYKY